MTTNIAQQEDIFANVCDVLREVLHLGDGTITPDDELDLLENADSERLMQTVTQLDRRFVVESAANAIAAARTVAVLTDRRAADIGVAGLVQVEVAPFQTVPLTERSFDAVAMIEVIEHLPEHRGPLAKAYRLLRPSGRLFLSATCYRSHAHQQEYENRPASVDAVELYGVTATAPLSQLLAELEDAGLSLRWLTDTTGHYGPTIEHRQRGIESNKEAMDSVSPGFADRLSRYFDTPRSSSRYTAKHYAVPRLRPPHGATLLPCLPAAWTGREPPNCWPASGPTRESAIRTRSTVSFARSPRPFG